MMMPLLKRQVSKGLPFLRSRCSVQRCASLSTSNASGEGSGGGKKPKVYRSKNNLKIRTIPMAKEMDAATRLSEISVDRSGLVNLPIQDIEEQTLASEDSGPVIKSPWTALIDELALRISVRGPISVAEFMTVALTHPVHGYYMTRDVFGEHGDFTTSPEISQVFGELIGVWCVANWMALGEPQKIRLVELGPGRGSLMSDLLRAAGSFPGFCAALQKGGGVNMVEASPALRTIQQANLGCIGPDGKPVKVEKPKTVSEGIHQDTEWDKAKELGMLSLQAPLAVNNGGDSMVNISWFREFRDVCSDETLEKDTALLVVAQELFDALPIHQFEFSAKSKQWVERLVDLDPVPETKGIDPDNLPETVDKRHHLRFVLSRGQTPACKVLLKDVNKNGSTRFNAGERVEVCAAGAGLIQDITKELYARGGAAIIIDYGENFPGRDSLRGIKKHKFVHPLSEPGLVDLSADVDFSFLKNIAEATIRHISQNDPKKQQTTSSATPRVYGPITQGDFLKNMGIETRVAVLLQSTQDESHQEQIFLAFKRLVEHDQVFEDGEVFHGMGQAYKALAIVSPTPGGTYSSLDVPGFPTNSLLRTVDSPQTFE